MDKTVRKLIAAVLSLILAAAMVVTISYAWMTLSTTPIAEGIQITIGGGNVILIAADQTVTVDGKTYHYPAHFNSTLNFNMWKEYDYLNQVSELSPVSTADGVHWLIPEYYDLDDRAVQDGDQVVGVMKPFDAFTLDTELSYGNLTSEEQADRGRGGYVYLDFWVVSPGTDYQLRVSQGDENGGSYLIELLEPAEVDSDTDGVIDSYTLTATRGSAAASARVGFLVNEDQITDDSMRYYQTTASYDSRYTKLRGIFHEEGEVAWLSSTSRFTIYEPNADLHPAGVNGSYTVTKPLSWQSGEIVPTDVGEHLTVQMTNSWKETTNTGLSFEELFQTAIIGKSYDSLDEMQYAFYHDYLQNQLMPYINKGSFVQNTSALYNCDSGDGVVDMNEFAALGKAGATDDVCIASLEKNVPQRIRMFVWLEGQDADCINALGNIDLALSIELAGSKIDENGETSTEQEATQQDTPIAGYAALDRFSLSLPVRYSTGTGERLRDLW